MELLRTPDERFNNLADYPFEPNYLEVDDLEGGRLRIHYVDEGPRSGKPVLLLHGQPAWSYLYRHMIPPLCEQGFRVIAPDLVGFGRSDKPAAMEDYTYSRHVSWMGQWLLKLDLRGITVFFQDWGSLIGLRLVAEFGERFDGVVLANGGLPAGAIPPEFSTHLKEAYRGLPVVNAGDLRQRFEDKEGVPGFLYWRKFCAETPNLDIAELMQTASTVPLTPEESYAYAAPFPDQSYVPGARRFPSLIPLFHDEPDVLENNLAWAELEKFDKPFLLAFSDNDPVTAGADQMFLDRVPGCRGMPHRTITNAAHFLQQEQPGQCVQAILDAVIQSEIAQRLP